MKIIEEYTEKDIAQMSGAAFCGIPKGGVDEEKAKADYKRFHPEINNKPK